MVRTPKGQKRSLFIDPFEAVLFYMLVFLALLMAIVLIIIIIAPFQGLS